MNDFTRAVVEQIKNIPKGKVMTYGQISAEAGNPKAARQVARILHTMTARYDLPWHRVISATGKTAIKDKNGKELQISLLEEEGVEFSVANIVDLEKYRHNK